jgi:hypothetical protein
LFSGTKLGFEDFWLGEECISEVGLEKRLNKDGLRYKMNRTEKEADEVGRLFDLPGFTVNLPLIGETGKLLVSPPHPTTRPDKTKKSRPSKRPVLPRRVY